MLRTTHRPATQTGHRGGRGGEGRGRRGACRSVREEGGPRAEGPRRLGPRPQQSSPIGPDLATVQAEVAQQMFGVQTLYGMLPPMPSLHHGINNTSIQPGRAPLCVGTEDAPWNRRTSMATCTELEVQVVGSSGGTTDASQEEPGEGEASEEGDKEGGAGGTSTQTAPYGGHPFAGIQVGSVMPLEYGGLRASVREMELIEELVRLRRKAVVEHQLGKEQEYAPRTTIRVPKWRQVERPPDTSDSSESDEGENEPGRRAEGGPPKAGGQKHCKISPEAPSVAPQDQGKKAKYNPATAPQSGNGHVPGGPAGVSSGEDATSDEALPSDASPQPGKRRRDQPPLQHSTPLSPPGQSEFSHQGADYLRSPSGPAGAMRPSTQAYFGRESGEEIQLMVEGSGDEPRPHTVDPKRSKQTPVKHHRSPKNGDSMDTEALEVAPFKEKDQTVKNNGVDWRSWYESKVKREARMEDNFNQLQVSHYAARAWSPVQRQPNATRTLKRSMSQQGDRPKAAPNLSLPSIKAVKPAVETDPGQTSPHQHQGPLHYTPNLATGTPPARPSSVAEVPSYKASVG